MLPVYQFVLELSQVKGQVAWISEKQLLPVKPPERLVFTVRSFTVGDFTTDPRERLRNICAYWCQSRWKGGGFAAARPSIVKQEIGGALAWNRGHLPFNMFLSFFWLFCLTCSDPDRQDRMMLENPHSLVKFQVYSRKEPRRGQPQRQKTE